MAEIQVLDQNTIDKIAAGEVVERPSSVVKELVENAIDAGATAVTVEITDGGKKLIRITDNGSGMEPSQVRMAFLRHATSKIRQVEDLSHIVSLGFRGEALSSIAAVSQVEMITKTPSGISGTRYVIEGGQEQKLEEMGAPEGTTFLVRNLFYNTPARLKFLKSDMTEAGYVSALMEQFSLSHPEVSFKYIQNRQVRLHSSGNCSMRDVIYSIYGKEITRSLLEVRYEDELLSIEGFVGKPEISRGNRSFENYAINGRFVKDRIVAKAIEDAYKGFLMQHKFPFVALHISMEGNDLDVNVHPSKMEVRFARGAEVYDTIFQVIRNALTGRELIPRVSAGKESPAREEKQPVVKPADLPEPFEIRRQQQFVKERSGCYGVPAYNRPELNPQRPGEKTFSAAEEQMFTGTLTDAEPDVQKPKAPEIPAPANAAPEERKPESPAPADAAPEVRKPETPAPSVASKEPEQMELFQEELLTPEARKRHKLIGQLFDTYWLVEFDEQFYIIDQHAAHEKVYYERFVKRFRERTVESQMISPPLIVTLNIEEEALLKANMDYFEKAGFEIENFGGREFAIRAVPVDLYQMKEEELFLEMLDHLASEGEKDSLSIFNHRLATMACKAAVKGNNRLSTQEANQLIEELLSLENPYHCPHGRPTIIAMTKQELEKKFKRIV